MRRHSLLKVIYPTKTLTVGLYSTQAEHIWSKNAVALIQIPALVGGSQWELCVVINTKIILTIFNCKPGKKQAWMYVSGGRK